MRSGISVVGSILSVGLCAVLAACGSTGSGSNGGNGGNGNVTMQAGQWEFLITPSNGAAPFYLEANLTNSGDGVFAAPANVLIYQSVPASPPSAIGLGFCQGFTLNGNISDNSLTGNLNSGGGQTATFSAAIAANGQSVSAGSYTGASCGFDSGQTTGTFTGYVVAPLNGTFTGTLTSDIYGSDQVSISITQNSNFDIDASGTSFEDQVTTTLAVSSGGAIGAILDGISGTATNVNGSSTFGADGHFNAAGTQLTIQVYDNSTGELITGTLTKQ